MKQLLVRIAVAALFSMPSVAAADFGKVLFVGAGTSLPLSPDEFSDFWGVGYGIGGGVGVPLGSREGLLVQTFAEYASHPLDKDAFLSAFDLDGLGLTVSGASANILNVHVNLKASMLPGGGASPYIVGGFGLAYLSASDITVIVQGETLTESFTDTETNVGFGLGAGIDFSFSERGGLFVEAKWLVGLDDDRTQTVPVRVGLFHSY